MPEIAGTIRIHDHGISIDGNEFRYYLADEPINVRRDEGNISFVTVTIICDAVEVDGRFGIAPQGDMQVYKRVPTNGPFAPSQNQ